MQDLVLAFLQFEPSIYPLNSSEQITPVIKFKYPFEDDKNHPMTNQLSSVSIFT